MLSETKNNLDKLKETKYQEIENSEKSKNLERFILWWGKWIEMEITMLWEIGQTKKDKYYIFSHLKNLDLNMFLYVVIEKKRGHRHEKEILGWKNGATSVTGSQKGGYVEEEGDWQKGSTMEQKDEEDWSMYENAIMLPITLHTNLKTYIFIL